MSEKLNNFNIILAVSAGIAAYKTVELVSQLKKQGAQVNVVLTAKAEKFVSPLSLEVISENQVLSGSQKWGADIQHIELAKKADLILIAPATANTIAKLANGISDEILFDTVLASNAPKIIAPAMNTNMWQNPIVQENLNKLKDQGYIVIDPEEGMLACKTYGLGRLASLENIINQVASFAQENFTKNDFINFVDLPSQDLTNKKVIVTLGATKEKIDPIRFISNRSSGKMGLALIETLLEQNAQVLAVHSLDTLPFKHERLQEIKIESAQELLDALSVEFEKYDALFMVAAVADYKVKEISETKLKKSNGLPQILLEENPDILKSLLALKKDRQAIIGFSVESSDAIAHGTRKLREKDLDLIVVNSHESFAADACEVYLLTKNSKDFMQASKKEIANELVTRMANFLREKQKKGLAV